MTAHTRRNTPYDLFPPLSPYSSGFLDVDDTHKIYWEQSGNPDGIPIVHLHGGPGAGATAKHRRFFDPDHYRIIIYDQRGAGRSQPLGSLINNTRQHLLDLPWTAEQQAAFEAESQASLAAQTAIEQADTMPFEMYRQAYVSEKRLGEHLPSPP